MQTKRDLLIAKGWIQGVAIVGLCGFLLLGILAYLNRRTSHPRQGDRRQWPTPQKQTIADFKANRLNPASGELHYSSRRGPVQIVAFVRMAAARIRHFGSSGLDRNCV